MGCKLEDVLQAYEIYDKVIHGALGDANLIYKSAAKMNGFTKTLNHEGWEYKDLLVFFLHTRGWSSSQSFLDPYASAFPAHAGVIPGLDQLMRGEICFSRTRGGNPCRSAKIPFQKE